MTSSANRTWPPSCSHGTYQHKAITSRSRLLLMMGTWLPETCRATIRREIKYTMWHLVGFSYPHSFLILLLGMSHGFIILTLKKNDWACNTVTLHLLARKHSKQCRLPARFFWLFLGLTKSLHDRIFGSWEYFQFSSVHWNNKKPTTEGVSS